MKFFLFCFNIVECAVLVIVIKVEYNSYILITLNNFTLIKNRAFKFTWIGY